MKLLSATLISILLLCSSVALTNAAEHELIVLDENTFVKIDRGDPENEIIQLFKITEARIDLVDAIELGTKQVNFKKLFEYRRLKVEEKE